MVGYPQELAHLELKTGETWKGQYHVGAEAQQKRESLLLKCPFEKGIVTDWDVIEKLWTHAFTQLLMSPAEEYGGVLLADAPNNPKDGRERMTHMMFERFQLPNFYIASQPLLAMYAAGRTTGECCAVVAWPLSPRVGRCCRRLRASPYPCCTTGGGLSTPVCHTTVQCCWS